MSFSKRLRQARERRQFTQAQLAERAGFKECAISRFETGGCNPSLRNFEKLRNALGVTADSLLGVPRVSDRKGRLVLCINNLPEKDCRLIERIVVRLGEP